MAMATRVELRHRPTKRPMATGTFNTNGSVITIAEERARMPRLEPKRYSTRLGLPDPTLVAFTTITV